MVNCYRKTKSPSGIHFSLFTFRSFMCICVHSRHLRNLRSDICHSERSEESPFFSGAGFLTTFGMTRGGVRNDKLMVNCQWLIVIGKRKVLRVFIFHFSLFVRLCVFASIRVICEICVRTFVIQSEAKNLLSFPGRDSSLRSE